MPVSSPCVGLCVIDNGTELCLGCGRTLDEIMAWGAMSEPQRLAVMEGLAERVISATGPDPARRDAGP